MKASESLNNLCKQIFELGEREKKFCEENKGESSMPFFLISSGRREAYIEVCNLILKMQCDIPLGD